MILSPVLRTGRLLAAGAVLTAALGPAAPAAGSSFGPARPGARNSNWGGYVARSGPYTKIIGSWAEPKVTCHSRQNLFAPWLGLDGYGSQTVEQAGVQTACPGGKPVNSPWYEMYPAAPVYWSAPVSAGDKITVTVTASGAHYTLTMTDHTEGWSRTFHKTAHDSDVSAEAVIESPDASYPAFRKLSFSGIRVDGRLLHSFHPAALDSGGYRPGPLRGGAFVIRPGSGGVRNGRSRTRPGVIRY